MNLNIQKAKIYVEECLAIVQFAGMSTEVKTRYGTSLLYANDRWANQGNVQRSFKVSFNSKSITIAEKFGAVRTLITKIDEKTCVTFGCVKGVLDKFLPPLTHSEAERANRRANEAFRALTGSTGSDIAVTVSAGADKAPTPPNVIAPSVDAVGEETPQVAIVENKNKTAMEKLVVDSGIPFIKEPLKYGTSYTFEGISITFSSTRLNIKALRRWVGNNKTYHPEYTTLISAKYRQDQVVAIRRILAVAKEAARLRAMKCFSFPEVSFAFYGSNIEQFIRRADTQDRTAAIVLVIHIMYRIDGYNHDGFGQYIVARCSYTKKELLGFGKTALKSESAFTKEVSYSKNVKGYGRYYNVQTPSKLMSIRCEEVSFTTNRDLLMSFGLKVSKESRYEEFYNVNVPLEQLCDKA